MELSAEQKMQLLRELSGSGAQIAQINFGNGVQNFYIGKREEIVREEEDADTYYSKENIIFNPRIFTSEAAYAELRDTILSFVKHDGASSEEKWQIDAASQNEWYYILKAIGEAGVKSTDKLTDMNFVSQMVAWFPALFQKKEGEDEKDMKRRIARSISNERGYWKNCDGEVAIKDMWVHHQQRGYEHAKTLRLHGVAAGLMRRLLALREK